MNQFGLLLKTLAHYRLSGAAVAFGAAVAAAVLGGALLVGASLPASLLALVERRLGPVERVVSAARPFPAELGERLAGEIEGGRLWPAWMATGSCRSQDGFAGRVQVLGTSLPGLEVQAGSCLLGAELARLLGATVGEEIEVWVGEPVAGGGGPLPRATEPPRVLRLQVARILAEGALGSLFALEAEQRPPRNCWVNLEELAGLHDRPGTATQLLVEGGEHLEHALERVLRLEDAGLRFRAAAEPGITVLESEALQLSEPVVAAARQVAAAQGIELLAVAANLAATVARAEAPGRPGRASPYVMVAGLDPFPEPEHGVLLGEWAARDLEASAGDRIALEVFARRPWGGLEELEATFPLLGTRRMQGLFADPSLTPELPGLTDADSIGAWDPPTELRLDLKRIRPIDEEFWERYRAAPRVFLPMDAAKRLWGGAVTSLRLPASARERFEAGLCASVAAGDLGFQLRSVRAEQSGAAKGSTDFGLLFLGFSFFLLVSAGLLVGLLFRLGVIARAPQLGLLQALGFGPRRVLALECALGVLLSAAGALVGALAAIGYAALMLHRLSHWWGDAVGSGLLSLRVEPGAIALGAAGSVLLALCGVAWAVLGLAGLSPGRLLAGETAAPLKARRGGAGWLACLLVLAATGWIGLGRGQALAFFGAGALLLAGGLAGLSSLLGRRSKRPLGTGSFAVLRLAMAGAGRNPGRSILTAGLVGVAAFVLFSVAAHQGGAPFDPLDRQGGSGGYNLIALAQPALPADPGHVHGRHLLALGEEPWWETTEIAALRMSAGADLSCLNLYRTPAARIAAVPSEWGRGESRFRFSETTAAVENPWTLLEQELPGGEIPAFADAESARWSLGVPLGGLVEVSDGAGRPVSLRLVGLLADSLFQGELLVGQARFERLFPEVSGFARLLIRTTPETETLVARALASRLSEYGLEVLTTQAWIGAFTRVAQTYMAAFRALGLLGLLLGGAGLAAVLLRNQAERQREFAILSWLGFSSGRIRLLSVAENGILYLFGLALGAASALVASLPRLLESRPDWSGLLLQFCLLALVVPALGLVRPGRRKGFQCG